jgi:ParB family chromosome partitioning protein
MNDPEVKLIPIDRIRVVNPRVRDPHAFQAVVDSIAGLGLKKPITVTRHAANGNGNGAERYDLVCGQGRLEAYVALGAREIPALVCDFSLTAGLLASLVENIARRRVRPLDQIKLVQWMKAQGDGTAEIARKTGLSADYLRHVFTLLERGEERLLEGVLHGEIPISIAIQIAAASDEESQRVLVEAFERKELTQKSVAAFKRILDLRRNFGRKLASRDNAPVAPHATADSLIAAYKREAQRQKLFIKKAKVCETRLFALAAAFKKLLADEHYVTLLRAEQMETMPKFLVEEPEPVT